MQSNYRPLGELIHQVKQRNTELVHSEPMGINISKEFMPSVANTIGTDLSKYRVVSLNQFAYNPMHVGRDEILPIAHLIDKKSIIVSPAYTVFEINDETVLNSEYLMMWLRRPEFDREAWFTTDNSVRGGFSWDSLCEMKLPVPSLDKQREIVREYNSVVNRIILNEELNKKLEETAQTLFKHWFEDFEFPMSNDYARSIGKPELEGKPYKSNGGEFDSKCNLPVGWKIKSISDIVSLCKRGIAPKYTLEDGLAVINQRCIRNNTVNYALSRLHDAGKKSVPEEKFLKQYDVLVNSTGTGTLGRVGVIKELKVKTTVDTHVTILRVKNLYSKLWFARMMILKSQEIVELAEGTTGQTELSRDNILNLEMVVPSVDIQILFDEYLNELVEYSNLLENEVPFNESIKKILLQKMVRSMDLIEG
jgi:type I restriction enzyme S subunit